MQKQKNLKLSIIVIKFHIYIYMKKSCNKRFKFKKRLAITIAIFFIISIFILWYFDNYVNPVILTTTYSKVKTLTSRAVNSSIAEILNNTDIYDSLIDITYDNNGKISSIQANAAQTNRLAKDISRLSLQKIDEIGETGISISLGSFTGMPILMGRGPEILIRTQPIGFLTCDYYYEFLSAGINQTVHRIYLYVTTDVNLILPIYNSSVQTVTEVMLCESIIIGEVPEVYLGNNGLSKLLDLVP